MMQGSINLDVKRVIGFKQFCNKLWNINKFALTNFPAGFQPEKNGVEGLKLSLSDKWILTRLQEATVQTNDRMEKYDFGTMVQGLYDFWLKELADYYIEALKPVMKGDDAEAKKAALNSLYICLNTALLLLHPAMPYITEELYQRLPHRTGEAAESIVIASYPSSCASFKEENVETHIANLQLLIGKFRSQIAALNIPKNANPSIYIRCSKPEAQAVFAKETAVLQSLLRSGETTILSATDADPEGCLNQYVNEDFTIYIKVVGAIDLKLEIARQTKNNEKLQDLANKLTKKINMKGYADKVPENVRKADQEKLNGYEQEIVQNKKGMEPLMKLI